MNEDQFLQLGQKKVFRVPEGYFDDFTDRMMAKIPQETPQKKTKLSVWRRPAWAAACVAVIIAGTAAFFFTKAEKNEGQDKIAAGNNTEYGISTEELQLAADYIMIDDDELYAYMAENY